MKIKALALFLALLTLLMPTMQTLTEVGVVSAYADELDNGVVETHTPEPTATPTPKPTEAPTPELTATPEATEIPTLEPTATPEETGEPTSEPTSTVAPGDEPTPTQEPEAPVIDTTRDASYSQAFAQGWVEIAQDALLRANPEDEPFATLSKGIGYALSRQNIGESKDCLLVAFAAEDTVQIAYIHAKDLRPLSTGEINDYFLVCAKSNDALLYQDNPQLPLLPLNSKPVVNVETLDGTEEETESNLPVMLLAQLPPPMSLRWGSNYSAEWNTVPEANGEYIIQLYRNAVMLYSGWWSGLTDSTANVELALEFSESGTYQFSVRSASDNWEDTSEEVFSPSVVYIKPSAALGVPTNLRWQVDTDFITAEWDWPANIAAGDGSVVELFRNGERIGRSWGYGSDGGSVGYTSFYRVGSWFDEPGTYTFSVKALSGSIDVRQDSPWSVKSAGYNQGGSTVGIAMTISPKSVVFKAEAAGYGSQIEQTFTVKNTGSATANLTAYLSNGAHFVIATQPTPSRISPNASTLLLVRPKAGLPAGNYSDTLNIVVNGNIVQTATLWFTVTAVGAVPTYTITYDANGGSGTPAQQTKKQGTALQLTTVKPTRTGYTFEKWNTNASGTGTNYASGASYTANASVKLYAIWKLNTYAVTYNANGGTGAPDAQTKSYGTALTLSTAKPTRAGYTFDKWNTNASGTGTNYASSASYAANASLSLYAVWKPITYAVKYEANATGVTGMPSAQTKVHGTALTLSATKPTRTGYTFDKWSTNAGGTGTKYASGASYTENAAVTLYAVWTSLVYSATISPTGTISKPVYYSGAVAGYGAQSAQVFTITNTGTGPITDLKASVESSFEITAGPSPASIAPNGKATVSVRPKTGLAGGACYLGTLTVTGSNGVKVLASLQFDVDTAPASSKLSVDQTAKTFSPAVVGYGTQAAQKFTVKNIGTRTITAINASVSGDFEITAGPSPSNFAPDASSTISVRPKTGLTAGTYTGALVIVGMGGIFPAAPLTVNLTFVVNPPTYKATVTPASKTFATEVVGYKTPPGAQQFTIKNTGTGTIYGLSASLSNTDFKISTKLSKETLKPDETATVSIQPVPGLAKNTYNGTLTFRGNTGAPNPRAILFADLASFEFTCIDWAWPTNSSTQILNQPFHAGHSGIDIGGGASVKILSSRAGIVLEVYTGCKNWDGYKSENGKLVGKTCEQLKCPGQRFYTGYCNYGNGNGVVILHADGSTAYYGHMKSVAPSVIALKGKSIGQNVELGLIGSTGKSSGIHLHFATSDKNGVFYDPMISLSNK